MSPLSTLVDDGPVGAAVSWSFVAVLVAGAAIGVIEESVHRSGFAIVVCVIAVVPAVLTRDATATVPWELLAVAALPVFVPAADVVTPVATYLAVAVLALLVAVEVDAFTDAEMPPRFAIFSVVLTTMAVAGVWTVLRGVADIFLGTALLGETVTLMWELALASLTGVGAGLVFEGYFRRRRARDRSPGAAAG